MPVHDWKRVPAGIFHDFHHGWLWTIKGFLSQVLPSNYYALAEQTTTGRFGPDVLALNSRDFSGSTTTTATMTRPKPKPTATFVADSDEEYYRRKKKNIAVKHISDDRVVAVIEVVSPGNKSSRKNFDQFVNKAFELLEQGIHLLIIDVCPLTKRDPNGIHAAIWEFITGESYSLPETKPFTAVSYERGAIISAYVEPFGAGETLPTMPVFLEPDFFVDLDLERTYNDAFAATPMRWQDELVP